ncbi:MAG: 5-formyltetrahydrofolate cyclo-ligase [Cyanobium sp.]
MAAAVDATGRVAPAWGTDGPLSRAGPLPPLGSARGPVEVKPELRRHVRPQRRLAMAAAPGAIAAMAAGLVPPLLAPSQRLGLYWPMGHEPDLRPLARTLPAAWRHQLALPAIRGSSMLYLPWQMGDPLEPDGAGIPAPLGAEGLTPDQLGLLLVPSLAVDVQGIRLGSGGGWYDRLRADPFWRAVPALAVVPALCVTAALPRDPWDVPLSGWLDETGLHWASGRVATS